jgi:GR25 family glycosyltransferase involved in LPS biosynthesis
MEADEIPMVCISLDRRPDRWVKFKSLADAAAVRVQRLSAVDAKEFDATQHPSVSLLTAHNIKHKVRRAHYEIDTGGAVGASLSHIKAWNYLMSSNASALIVFEDDATIPPDFQSRLNQVVDELPAEWDIITFYNTVFMTNRGCAPNPKMAPLESCTGLMGAHAYMISRRGAQRMLARAYPIELHVDAFMAFMARMGYIQMLWNPCMQVEQPFDDSDIAHGNTQILSVPTNIENTWMSVLDMQSVMALLILSAVAGGIISLSTVRRL